MSRTVSSSTPMVWPAWCQRGVGPVPLSMFFGAREKLPPLLTKSCHPIRPRLLDICVECGLVARGLAARMKALPLFLLKDLRDCGADDPKSGSWQVKSSRVWGERELTQHSSLEESSERVAENDRPPPMRSQLLRTASQQFQEAMHRLQCWLQLRCPCVGAGQAQNHLAGVPDLPADGVQQQRSRCDRLGVLVGD